MRVPGRWHVIHKGEARHGGCAQPQSLDDLSEAVVLSSE